MKIKDLQSVWWALPSSFNELKKKKISKSVLPWIGHGQVLFKYVIRNLLLHYVFKQWKDLREQGSKRHWDRRVGTGEHARCVVWLCNKVLGSFNSSVKLSIYRREHSSESLVLPLFLSQSWESEAGLWNYSKNMDKQTPSYLDKTVIRRRNRKNKWTQKAGCNETAARKLRERLWVSFSLGAPWHMDLRGLRRTVPYCSIRLYMQSQVK